MLSKKTHVIDIYIIYILYIYYIYILYIHTHVHTIASPKEVLPLATARQAALGRVETRNPAASSGEI
jgi:hypothetical protein